MFLNAMHMQKIYLAVAKATNKNIYLLATF
jgi:hypothetical protein